MSNKIFTTVPVPRFPRSTFSLSRPVAFTPRMHKEYPTEIIEVLPGDGIKIHTESYALSMPMVAPTFAKMDVAQESFFVPCWQLSKHFDDFITGGERGSYQDKLPYLAVGPIFYRLNGYLQNNFGLAGTEPDAPLRYNETLTLFQDVLESFDIMRSIPFVVPAFTLMVGSWNATVATANYNAFNSANSFLQGSNLRINLLPFAAVLKVWCEFYRDENLCDDLYSMYWLGEYTGVDFTELTGNVNTNLASILNPLSDEDKVRVFHAFFGLKSRAWKKDYFTSALPFVQKGPDVMLPLVVLPLLILLLTMYLPLLYRGRLISLKMLITIKLVSMLVLI